MMLLSPCPRVAVSPYSAARSAMRGQRPGYPRPAVPGDTGAVQSAPRSPCPPYCRHLDLAQPCRRRLTRARTRTRAHPGARV